VNSLWRLPLKSLAFLAMMVLAVLVGIVTPVVAKTLKDRVFSSHDMSSWFYPLVSFAIPVVVTFIGLSLFYKLAPRRHTRFSEDWVAALSATVILQAAESLFVVYIKNFAALNVVYGAFGGIIALLLWIYYSGYIFIFGACLCAAQAELNESSVKTAHRSAA
jgi:Ca2+-transporting ATPase